MNVTLNGEREVLRDGMTIGGLLKEKSLDPGTVVVECNRVIIDRTDYDTTIINDNDTLEVLRFVGGG